MRPPHLHLPKGTFVDGAPMLAAPVVLADANVSVGVAGLVVAIIALVVVLLAIIAVEVAGEHWDNVRSRHPH
jgi:hypothetical protein